MLCSFPQPKDDHNISNKESVHLRSETDQHPERVREATHKLETAILCTSKQVYQEAYDIIIKTNQFVRIELAGGYFLCIIDSMIRTLADDTTAVGTRSDASVPIIATTTASASLPSRSTNNFNGYVLSFKLKKTSCVEPNAVALHPSTFLILGQDLGLFCEILQASYMHHEESDISISVSIGVRPGTLLPKFCHQSLADFFTSGRTNSLLQPLRTHLRGLSDVKISGKISDKLRKAVKEELSQDCWRDPDQLLQEISDLNALIVALVEAKSNVTRVILVWKRIDNEITSARTSRSWEALIVKGGDGFLNSIAEQSFLCNLEIASLALKQAEADYEDTGEDERFLNRLSMVARALLSGERAQD